MSDRLLVDVEADLRRAWDPQAKLDREELRLLLVAHPHGELNAALEAHRLVEKRAGQERPMNSLRPLEGWLAKARPPEPPMSLAAEGRSLTETEIAKRVARHRRRLMGGEIFGQPFFDAAVPYERTELTLRLTSYACRLAREEEPPEAQGRKLNHSELLDDCRDRVLKRASETESATVRRCLLAYAECLEAERKAGPEEAVPVSPAAERRARELQGAAT